MWGALQNRIPAWVVPVVVFGGSLLAVLAGVVPDDSKTGLLPFIVNLPTVVIQVGFYVTIGAAALWVAQWIRNQRWFDRFNPAREMVEVQARIGTSEEKEGDAQACARQHAGNSLFYGMIVLALLIGFLLR